jgi:hypothetical protein
MFSSVPVVQSIHECFEQLDKEKGKITEVFELEFSNEIVNDSAVYTYLDKLLNSKMNLKELELLKAEAVDLDFEEEREHILSLKEVYEEYYQY